MADLSPELASRIQSLEASYAANPGRYFVALAGAWREGGDIAMAERILRENIGKFPGLSAHVLLGRCLADRGAFPEAANEFHYVLSIDSQNLIALRTLAEMAAVGGRRAEAERWYGELLAVDPMNAEARATLSQLARTPAAPAPPAEPAWGDVAADEPLATAGGAADDDGEFGMIDLGAPDASPADASGAAADEDADLGEWGDLSLDAQDETPAQPAPAAAEAGGTDFDAFGFGSVDLDAQADEAPAAAPASDWLEVDARQDVGESAAADVGGLPLLDGDTIDAPLAGADLPLLDADDTVQGFASAVSEPGAGFGFGEPSTGTFDHVTHEADGHDAEAEVVTETMAELYASQGLLAQAADVYRELISQRGDEPSLMRRLGEIEARMQPAGSAERTEAAAEPAASAEETPDWLESVDAFARGGGEQPLPDAGLEVALPDLDLSPALSDEAPAPAEPAETPGFSVAYEPVSDVSGGDAETPEFSVAEPADVAAVDAEPELAAGPVAASTSADPFADSFAHGFEGAPEAAPVAAGVGAEPGGDDGRQAWESPSVAATEPIGFDILVVADEEGAEVPAPPEVVADVSADWAIAAAPLGDDEEAAEADFGAAGAAADYTPPAPGTRTVAAYFAGLLAWQPGGSAPAPATYEVSVDDGGLSIAPAAPEAPADEPMPFESAAPEAPAEEPIPFESAAPEAPAEEPIPFESAAPEAPAEEPLPFDAAAPAFPAAPEIPTFDAPAFQPPPAGEPVFGGLEPEAEAEPWTAPAEDEPWAATAPGESAPEESAATPAAPEALPLLDLEEPWAEAPAAPREPVDIAGFTLAEDTPSAPPAEPAPAAPAEPAPAEPEELLPWEVPAEPSAAAPEPAPGDAGGFSFEDFFSGAPAAQPEPEPELPAPPPAEPEPPAFIPSFAEPTPPPVFEPAFTEPAPPPAPAPPAAPAAQGQDEDDEDLESFQAWLQSLKR